MRLWVGVWAPGPVGRRSGGPRCVPGCGAGRVKPPCGAGLVDAQRERPPPRRQRCRWVALVGTPAFENTAESNMKVLAVARETAGGLKPGSAPLGMTWKWPPATVHSGLLTKSPRGSGGGVPGPWLGFCRDERFC